MRERGPRFDYNGHVSRKSGSGGGYPPALFGGTCSVCGAGFVGPKNRKFCDEHSKHIRYTGRNSGKK